MSMETLKDLIMDNQMNEGNDHIVRDVLLGAGGIIVGTICLALSLVMSDDTFIRFFLGGVFTVAAVLGVSCGALWLMAPTHIRSDIFPNLYK